MNRHCKLKQWKILSHEHTPKGQPILDYVWDMKKESDIVTRQAYKWKARLNIHG